MAQINSYKPRYTISIKTKSKVWPYKNSYFRRFYALRARRLKRGGLFLNCVLVANRIKWIQLRRFFKPVTKTVGFKSIPIGGKTVFGRPFKQRYSNLFYIKQQLRFFYGKLEEDIFRNCFQKHCISVTKYTRIFFNTLESRLDIIFFRIRLLPTIFACHQFIHHQGLELNNKIEKAPSTTVRVGDIIIVSPLIWNSVYKKILRRIYFRRWGLFVRRRRLFHRFKKYLYLISSRPKRQNKSIANIETIFNTSKRFIKKNQSFIVKKAKNAFFSNNFFGKKIRFSIFKSYFNRLSQSNIVKSNKTTKKDSAVFSNSINNIKYSRSYFQAKNRMQHYFSDTTIDSIKIKYIFRSRLRTVPTDKVKHITFFKKYRFIEETKTYQNRINQYIFWMNKYSNHNFNSTIDLNSITKFKLYNKKQARYLKLNMSMQIRKSFLPRRIICSAENNFNRSTNIYFRFWKRSSFRRFYWKANKKKIRYKKYPRLKAVHFYVPSYIQMDFRTLSAIKRESPTLNEIYFPFRTSLAKVYSFYRSKGI